jgi:hypothetical protein
MPDFGNQRNESAQEFALDVTKMALTGQVDPGELLADAVMAGIEEATRPETEQEKQERLENEQEKQEELQRLAEESQLAQAKALDPNATEEALNAELNANMEQFREDPNQQRLIEELNQIALADRDSRAAQITEMMQEGISAIEEDGIQSFEVSDHADLVQRKVEMFNKGFEGKVAEFEAEMEATLALEEEADVIPFVEKEMIAEVSLDDASLAVDPQVDPLAAALASEREFIITLDRTNASEFANELTPGTAVAIAAGTEIQVPTGDIQLNGLGQQLNGKLFAADDIEAVVAQDGSLNLAEESRMDFVGTISFSNQTTGLEIKPGEMVVVAQDGEFQGVTIPGINRKEDFSGTLAA